MTDIFADEHISLFLRHARRRAEDTVAGLVRDAAPPDTNAGVVVDPTPGAAAPVVAVGPTTDVVVGTADVALPGVADFDPTPAGRNRGAGTVLTPDGADFEPTSPGSASARGSDTTAAMPIDTGRVVGGVSDGRFDTDAFADDVLSDGGFGTNTFADEVLSEVVVERQTDSGSTFGEKPKFVTYGYFC